jgi:hypothetical protein
LGHTKDAFMQNCLRGICFYAANWQFEVKAKHISGIVDEVILIV